jgi:hypothetical protein
LRFWYKRPADAPLPRTPDPTPDVPQHEYQYRGYRVLIYAKGEGSRVEIYAPGSEVCERVVNYDGAPAARDVITEDIKQIIDRMS